MVQCKGLGASAGVVVHRGRASRIRMVVRLACAGRLSGTARSAIGGS